MRHFVISLDRPDHDKLQWFFGSCSTFSHLRVTPGFLYWTTRNSNVMCTLGESLESRQWLYSVAPKDTPLVYVRRTRVTPRKMLKVIIGLGGYQEPSFSLESALNESHKEGGDEKEVKEKEDGTCVPLFHVSPIWRGLCSFSGSICNPCESGKSRSSIKKTRLYGLEPLLQEAFFSLVK